MKKVKKTYIIYGKQWKETICELLELQKMSAKGPESLLKEIWLRIF